MRIASSPQVVSKLSGQRAIVDNKWLCTQSSRTKRVAGFGVATKKSRPQRNFSEE